MIPRKLRSIFDTYDAIFVIALGLIFLGMWQIHPPLAFVSVGLILLILIVLPMFKREPPRGPPR